MSSRGGRADQSSEETRQRTRERNREAARRFYARQQATVEGRAKLAAKAARSSASPAGRAARARYAGSEKGQAAIRNATARATGHVTHSVALRTALHTAERTSATSRVPMAHVFAPDGSQPLPARRALGGAQLGHIPFTTAEQAQLPGTIVTFSHPTPGGLTADEVRFAATNGLAELRAADSRSRYALTPPPGGWNADFAQNLFRQDGPYDTARAAMRASLGRAVNAGKTTHALGMQYFNDHVWRRVAKVTGMGYSTIKWYQKLSE